MKRVFLVMALVILAGCSARNALKRSDLPEKKELEVWQVMRHAGEGKRRFNIEDTWYIYCMDLSYISVDKPGQTANESMGGQCPIEKAAYMVYDKETKTVVRDTVLPQERCADCHRR